MRRPIAAVAAVLLAAPVCGVTGEGDVRLRDGPGRVLVQANCLTCHSLDYIQMNSPFLDREGWQKSVEKMIKVMGAPIRPQDIAPIVDYLVTAYGRPAPVPGT